MSKWYPCIYCTEDLHCTKYTDNDHESWCVLGPCTAETPSNADRIRSMSDEELAEFLQDVAMQGGIELGGRLTTWLDWMKEEAKE